MRILLGIIIPFIGTILGSAMVFIMKNKMNERVEKLLLGFASGIMIAASIWSLIIPSIDMAKEQNNIAWLPTTLGFILGILFLMLLDYVIPKLKLKRVNKKNRKTAMMVLAVTLHDIPEGAIISMPLKSIGMKKKKSFYYGALSGIVEPLGALITILLIKLVVPILPVLLSFAAGAMIYVVINELIPESQNEKNRNIGTIGITLGFLIMMILDVSL